MRLNLRRIFCREIYLKLRYISIAKGRIDGFLCRASSDRRTVLSVLALKAISDEIYQQQFSRLKMQTRRELPLYDCVEVSMPSAEEALEGKLKLQELEMIRVRLERFIASGLLTETQRRRFSLYCMQSLSTRQIARSEGVRQFAVWKSLVLCQKKIQLFWDKQGGHPPV